MGNKILVGSNFVGFKNRIINGDFQVWQRGEDVTLSKQGGYIGVDRFFTWQLGKDSSGNNNYSVCDVENKKEYDGQDIISSYYISNVDTSLTSTKFGVTHRVEPLNYWDLIDEKITISFWIKTNKNIFNFYIWHTYIDSNGNETSEGIYSEDISIQSDVWTKIERTVTLSSANYVNIDKEVFTELFAVKIYDVADNDYIQLKQVQVEVGNIATEFEYIPYDIQLQRCLRYYEKNNALAKYMSNDNIYGTYYWKIEKRSTPAIAFVSPDGNLGKMKYHDNAPTDTEIDCYIVSNGNGGNLGYDLKQVVMFGNSTYTPNDTNDSVASTIIIGDAEL